MVAVVAAAGGKPGVAPLSRSARLVPHFRSFPFHAISSSFGLFRYYIERRPNIVGRLLTI